jgi:hypothetical protein
MTMEEKMVAAIRSCPLVGSGSCSTISECFDDADIIEELASEGIDTIQGAVKWALDFEQIKVEQALNQRWGDDDDWQLKAWEKWQVDRAAFEAAQ